MSDNKVTFGLSSWSDPPVTGQKQFDDKDRIPFAKLKNGQNIVRFITPPYKYFRVAYKEAGEKGLGTNIKISADLENDPALKAGLKKKERAYAGIINRATSQVEILDMGGAILGHLHGLDKNPEYGNPQEYDVAILRNEDAAPANFYTVLPRTAPNQTAPLSEADLAMREECKDRLAASLERLSSPNTAEDVLAKMIELGYKEGTVLAATTSNGASKLKEADDEDYSFDAPATAAQAS